MKDKNGNKRKQKKSRDDQKRRKTEPTLSDCSSVTQLKNIVKEKKFDLLPEFTEKTFCNTGKAMDKMSIDLMPSYIPLHVQNDQLHPATICGDGNCLPRSASLLVYGHENNHQEMRERIVCELVKNSEVYLDNQYLRKGMNPQGYQDVAKTFASYSSMFMGDTPLNKESIRKLCEEEVLSVCKNGTYMGLWQLASLSNILSCPVVSVYPTYGGHTVHKDMHRIFYPVQEKDWDKKPVFIMWTNARGKNIDEKNFTVNHFVVLMPFSSTTEVVIDISFDEDEDNSLPDSIWNILNEMDIPDPESLAPEKPDPESLAPEKPDPESLAPEKPDPESLAPEKPDPESLAPEKPDPESLAPEKPDPESLAPEKPDPESLAQEKPDPESLAPEKPDPESLAPEKPDPESLAPENPDPESLAPEKPDPESLAPEKPDPESLAPERPDPELSASEKPDPESLAPEKPDPEPLAPEKPDPKPLAPERPGCDASSARTTDKAAAKMETDTRDDGETTRAVISIGDYILCRFQTKKKTLLYIGEVLDVSEGSTTYVEFLENTKSPFLKKRKFSPERALVDNESIVKTMEKPETVFKRREVLLQFAEL